MSLTPQSVLSYYPNYALLDEIVSYKNYKKINIFVDLKNCLQALYMEHAVNFIVESSIGSKYIDTSIFSSIISFLSFHKLYSIKRNIDINMYIFFETGDSYFHKNIEPRYKISRKNDNLYGLDREKRDKFYEVVQKNLQTIEMLCHKMPNTKVIRMKNLDADFIPYYIFRNKLVPMDNETASVVYSADHDMVQNIKEDFYVYQKHYTYKRIIGKNQAISNFLKIESKLPDEYLPLAMALDGDVGDDIPGIKGIGKGTIAKILEDIVQMVGGMDLLNQNVFNNKPIFINPALSPNKYIDKILEAEEKDKRVSKNLKLSSYELLSRYMDDPIDTEMINKKEYLMKQLETVEVIPYKSMLECLTKVGIMLDTDVLENIYYEKQNDGNSYYVE